jgi:hypothetical protein
MSEGRRARPILLLIAVFGLLPAAFVLLVFLPVKKRMAADEARLFAAVKRSQELPNIQPLSAQERLLVEDPKAPWRTRIQPIENDAQRLAHYNRVVTDLQQSLKGQGVVLAGVRSTWNPIQGSFTLPANLPAGPTEVLSSEPKVATGHLEAWVLEAQVGGSPDELFKALETLPRINPLLEPVALRWDFTPPAPKQTIILRNLVSMP